MKLQGLLAALLFLACGNAEAAPAEERDAYLALAKAAFEKNAKAVPGEVERWIEEYEPVAIWGFGPPAAPIWLSGLAASLHELTGEERYAQEALRWMAEMPRFKQYCPESLLLSRPDYAGGLPTLTDFFHLGTYCQAWLRVRESASVTLEQQELIERSIAESADYALVNPEWGPMNRAILRAEGLELAAKALPDHAQAASWRRLAKILAEDSRGKWEEEDTSIYHPVWLLSLIHDADLRADAALFDLVTVRYYFDYFLHLMSPTGMVPEFGDSRFDESWPSYLACFERGAAEYGRVDLKWAARRVFSAMTARHGEELDSRSALLLLDAYRWADDGIEPVPPEARSEEVLEDLVGKKIVFRDGFGDEDTFLLLNYRDEGPFARTARDFLRRTIPVEEEKMHHGHADENAICLLMSGGSVLLKNPGYRDAIPSGEYGAFRADLFHNTFVGRNGKRDRQQPLFEFLRNSGAYHKVVTEKIDFLDLRHVAMSRTRVRDEQRGYESDRVIVYLEEEDVFLVVDIAKILETGYYTFTTLWHGTTVLEQEEGNYVIATDTIPCSGGHIYEPPRNRALRIRFLQQGIRRDGTFLLMRTRQQETAVYQTISSHYQAGQVETFVTLLVPTERATAGEPWTGAAELLAVEGPRQGVGVRLEAGGATHTIGIKTDLDQDVLTENVRPRYTFESGKVQYGPFCTDAGFLHARRNGKTLSWSAANLVKLLHDGRTLFAARTNTYALEPDDLGTGYGPMKWRYWEDEVTLD
ncbi:MAG: hypothetical protein V2A76_07470 [Planctomycetota bacterium]